MTRTGGTHTVFEVDRDDYARHRTVEVPDATLAEGEIRVRVDRFAFTANNVTYAVVGDLLGYWQFFPAADDSGGRWGVIPVWAFGDVEESRCAEVPEGERLYGYFPPATSVVMSPTRVSAGSLVDGVEHRSALPSLYNRYRRVLAEPDYDRADDEATALLGPLHLTSYALWHRLASRDFHGAEQVVIVSASSKTSLGLALALAQDDDAPDVVGLTSSGNLDFVGGTGLYDAVAAYDEIAETLPPRPTVVVDMSGDATVAAQLRDHLGGDLALTLSVGMTHWQGGSSEAGSGAAPAGSGEFFFAPSYLLEMMKELGPGELDRRSTAFLRDAAAATSGWMSIDHRSGLEGLADVYPDVLAGTFPPSSGVVVEL